MTKEHRIGLLKTVPGLLVSAFFLWWTFVRRNAQGARPVNLADFRGVHIAAPVWIAAVLAFSIAGYTVRCYRSWRMLRSVKARFSACARVLMTSLAANNILPLRIGDVMRIFTYAGDLNATPSIILSTVILEKLLDVFTLAVLFAATMRFGNAASPKLQLGAETVIAVSSVCLLAMVFGAHTLKAPMERLFAKTKNARLAKVEHWLLLALEIVDRNGVWGTLWLVACSFVAWLFEGLLYLSAMRAVGLRADAVAPWQTVAQANLSFLVPSSPGGIGPFEAACKDALVRQGVPSAAGGIFGLLMHVYLLIAITGVGGAMFLAHRLRRPTREPLLKEIDELPAQLP